MTKAFFNAEEHYEHGIVFYDLMGQKNISLGAFFAAAATGYEPAWNEISEIIGYKTTDADQVEKCFRSLESNEALPTMNTYKLGIFLYWYRGNWEEALDYLLKAAEAQIEYTYQMIGYVYHHGKHDIDKAKEWYEKAASTDHFYHPYSDHYEELLLSKIR
jgi:tetratricopeptide (TPR) repeat protein